MLDAKAWSHDHLVDTSRFFDENGFFEPFFGGVKNAFTVFFLRAMRMGLPVRTSAYDLQYRKSMLSEQFLGVVTTSHLNWRNIDKSDVS